MPNRFGAFSSQMIRALMDSSSIEGSDTKRIRPASLDLAISDEIYRIDGIFQPRSGEKVRDLLPLVSALPHNISSPLERGVTYIVKLSESLKLPADVFAYCNPKSSVGRNDIQVRVIADGVSRFDTVAPAGFSGELWLVIQPNSFAIKMENGMSLSQIRFFNSDTGFNENDLTESFDKDKLLWEFDSQKPFEYKNFSVKDGDGSIILTLAISSEISGWESLEGDKILDLSKIGAYEPEEFFRPIAARDGIIKLRQGRFYILQTDECVRVPSHLACEMIPMDARSGEFRSHYAGYIDPGWGYGNGGDGVGRRLVLEVRPFEPLTFRKNQPVAKIRFERMAEVPSLSYDILPDSNYASLFNAPRLSKQFKSF
ncbi:MAG: hypothetical protein COU07_01485 [Candidatus Harrisonbacteria bacterium CG10_big_fil_rev_8_21_14_0_10_40_38]|uniref:2'-deoxycytidine 5'-triphosphate deaminase n=1 Tax=Candidatus Harrisonbacteria bacterium CG10_big_fil_rev_8_21_14_0_10_40_38 TaxID=1974583 RepID=A0A2H0UT10_9BACT|nr:MAG: hypothetical protein COU07_01485 [Candidatus Harrisonbacteria bacterium CG10_big_fil_rev_8_21_14_0_10_40_38]